MSVLYALLFYVATVIFVVGMVMKIRQYWNTPAPLKIPTTPAPTTATGVVFRMAREVLVFESLFKSNRWIWIFGYLFHVGLALVTIRHLRYFIEDVPTIIMVMQPLGVAGGFMMIIGLIGLWTRRIVVERIRYITNPSDHLILLLLVMIGFSGMMMKFISHTDIVMLKTFILGLFGFSIHDLPLDFPLLVHLLLVATLMIIFPFSKLLHAPGIFFSPTRNQIDNPREQRHTAPWTRNLDKL
ncbi:MAG: respiratory nitrate reductase subunit gamma [Gammaproteobacteria bacterium]|nr:respiratory nitrate reductase subunit gamma [Gammaproteobacteria bacterium]